MSLNAFKNWVESAGVDFTSLDNDAKIEYRDKFDSRGGAGNPRVSFDNTAAIFALAVKDTEVGNGVQLSGNCFAVGRRIVVTAFHNIYDELDSSYDQSLDSPTDFLFQNVSAPHLVIRIFKFALVSRCVIKQGIGDQEQFTSAVLLRFIEGNYEDDWALLEIVSGENSFCGVSVDVGPVDFKFLDICPDDRLPVAGTDSLKGYHFDIALYKASEDPEETLDCQRVEYSLITMYKAKSRVFRLQGALSFGSCGSPTINKYGEAVTIHLASLDSTAKRQPKTRFRVMRKDGKKRAKLTSSNLKLLAKETDDHLEVVYEEQDRVLEEMSSIAESFTYYKEGFVLCKSPRFMELLGIAP